MSHNFQTSTSSRSSRGSTVSSKEEKESGYESYQDSVTGRDNQVGYLFKEIQILFY